MQTEVCVNNLNCHIHVPSKQVLANREANSRHTYDVTIWLSRTTDNSNIFIRSHEVRDNESRLYNFLQFKKRYVAGEVLLMSTHNTILKKHEKFPKIVQLSVYYSLIVVVIKSLNYLLEMLFLCGFINPCHAKPRCTLPLQTV